MLNNLFADQQKSFQVAVRYLPLQVHHMQNLPEILCVDKKNNQITLVDSNLQEKLNKKFCLDKVYDLQDNQSMVYNEIVEPLVESSLNGFNATLLVYGEYQQSKDFTLEGDKSNLEEMGIIPRVSQQIFSKIEQNPNKEFIIRVSSLQILNENINDLLQKQNQNLFLRENQYHQVFVEKLTSVLVTNHEEFMKQIELAKKNSLGSSNTMNNNYVRGHTIHQIQIQKYDKNSIENALNVSILNIVSLAGFERISKVGCFGKNLSESILVNKSLSTLEKVTIALSKPGNQHIPYRESQLTRILQNSLGGNSKTVLLTVISIENYETSLQALKFAERAKNIKNKPSVNKIQDNDIIKSFREQYSSISLSRNSSFSNLSQTNNAL
ncbi:kinesin motor catalytic domain protein (macronuclear) [Tetrahymena thermophila SB210]|uniref:Kinesin motor catalytic domain protein n=1 Tax=Tetrahymena thermophila (strain SB210) TaxID=312017 RepID=I7M853_TETTS|nr:kinesin motor catalytic domain protein [Tetrahymena thermophila SB210]EAR97189.1 kinesin motor catalytic domain protein [Tetrahymena thermophila SB210]|eukprot:XP_001017434.1 kinesin motor catalytic domain protein [Tetrahymena thermophila SB210]